MSVKSLIELTFALWEKEVVSTEELMILVSGALPTTTAIDEAVEHILTMEDERDLFSI